MATVSPKMGLRVWNLLTDPYDHDQLADNWFKVDFHDHTNGRGVQIPTEGIADGAVTRAKLAAGAVGTESLTATKTGNYTATASDDYIPVSAASGAVTITLYAASGNSGRRLKIARTDLTPANVITIDGNASETINGTTTITITAQYEVVELECDGSNWTIVHRHLPYSYIPTGMVDAFAGTAAPTGWLACNGAAISRTTYAALFAVIGETHGEGDNSTTFNVPDYRGRFLRGVDGGAANDPDRASRTAMATGGVTGDNVGSVQADQMINHTHTIPYTTSGIANTGRSYSADGAQVSTYTTSNPSVGGSETRPKNANVLYIIKT